MRIALTVDPEVPVPPRFYGGIERIVDMLARGLAARGHEVTLFAHPDSSAPARLIPWPGRNSRSRSDTIRNTLALLKAVGSGAFDILHSMSRVAYMTPLLPLSLPKLMTYHRQISRRSVRLGTSLSRGTLWFSAVSRQMTRGVADIGTWRIVLNGVPLATYQFCPDPGDDAPLVFLGRIEEIKGPHLAIEIARRVHLPLVIAGNVAPEHSSFFEERIRPHLDGSAISYVGPVDDAMKNELLGRARAFLMPILWEEPAGMVVIEAMACGTPVVGLARGGVPEYVEHGVTGYLADDVEGMIDGIRSLDTINRRACRERVERLFSDRAVVDAYEQVYLEMIDPARRAAMH
jgi:glycosyltransferase involved in cell wall biosynthesis